VEFVLGKIPLQKKKIDCQSERIAIGQTLRAIDRHGAPLEVGKVLQAETLGYDGLGVSGVGEL
jgi:hypothetical protein